MVDKQRSIQSNILEHNFKFKPYVPHLPGPSPERIKEMTQPKKISNVTGFLGRKFQKKETTAVTPEQRKEWGKSIGKFIEHERQLGQSRASVIPKVLPPAQKLQLPQK
jgi:hypothetical protein